MLFGSKIFFKTFLGKELSLQILRRMHEFCDNYKQTKIGTAAIVP